MRALLLLCLILTALCSGSAAAQRKASATPPNIVLIVADDLGWGDLSSYGAKDLRTPNIDALAADGIRFDRFYANSPVCSPTRASLMTGRYPDVVGVPGVIRTHPENSWGYLAPSATLLPKQLQRAGYHTALVGKWHLGLTPPNTPNDRGFDHFHGFLGDMMDDYSNHRRHDINYMRLNRREIDPPGHATSLFTDWAVEYVRERGARKQPFFLYLAYNAPHVPIQPPDAWVERVKRREAGIDDRRARLAALVEQMDDGVGQVVAALKASGAYENTLIVFTSDNGGQISAGGSNGPVRGAKEDVYEGGIRVPMCAAWPGRIRGGARTEQVALSMDLMPTLCNAAGAQIPSAVDGASLLPVLTGKAERSPDRTLFFVRREGGPKYQGKTIHAVRRGDWKLVHNSPFEPMQLFNLSADPLETTDLSARNRDVFNELGTALRAHIRRAGAVPWAPPVSVAKPSGS
jgi:arylsulfatase A-like enzyme